MESNLHQDYSNKTASSSEEEEGEEEEEETNRSNHPNHVVGTGRSYECVFCKQGFTTAQALGGHMNIHRKDRANKPSRHTSSSSSVSSLPSITTDDYYANFRGYPSPNYSAAAHHHELLVNYQTLFPATWGFRPPQDELYVQSTQLLNHCLDDDWRRHSLSLQIGPLYSSSSSASHADSGKQEVREDGSEANDLDLELRLGHRGPSS